MNVVVALGIALACFVVFAGIMIERRDSALQARLLRYAQPTRTLEDMELQAPITQRIFMPALRRLADILFRLTPGSQVTDTRHKLALAGLAGTTSVSEFLLRRFLLALALGGACAFFLRMAKSDMLFTIALSLPLFALGYMLPSVWLGGRIRTRQTAIQRSLADAIDLLTVCVEAGSGFDAGLSRVVAKSSGPLIDDFERLLGDLRMGKPRRDALKEMADRTGVEDVQSFISALIQADMLGVGLVKVLRVQAEQMRQRRRLRAEERAAKAPIKMLFPMILLIFPCVYILILGPAIIRMMSWLQG